MDNVKTIKIGSEVYISAQDLRRIIQDHENEILKNREPSIITDVYHLATIHAVDIIDLIIFSSEGLEVTGG